MSHLCNACGADAVVQWQRRPTETELADFTAVEQDRQTDLGLPPEEHRLPTAADTVIAVFACADHAVHIDLAARVHAATCRAPHDGHLPGCDCEPEPLPEPDQGTQEMVTLPTGWTVPAGSTSPPPTAPTLS